MFVDITDNLPPVKIVGKSECSIAFIPDDINGDRFHSIRSIFTPELNIAIVHLYWN